VPPDNRPTPEEVARCAPFLDREIEVLRPRAVLALGAIAWDAALAAFARAGAAIPRPRPRFAHGAEARLAGAPALVASYHVSRQNTNTGRLTTEMFEAVVKRALELAS
jgi:uracil-DNA glycosylase family 4